MAMSWNSNYTDELPWPLRWGQRILAIIIIIIVISIIPTPREGIVTESYFEDQVIHKRDIKLDRKITDQVLAGGRLIEETYSEGGENLRLVLNIASTKELRLTVESKNGFEVDEKKRIFDYNITIEGPSIGIKLKNPLDLQGSATVSGTIIIIHEYDEIEPVEIFIEVNGTEWRAWWKP